MTDKQDIKTKECNRSAKRTKKLISDSFYELMEHKPCFKISVRELTEHADINRSTFYLHYVDIPYLIDQLEAQICDQAVDAVSDIKRSKYVKGEHPLHIHLFQVLIENQRQCQLLLGPNGDIKFLKRLTDSMEDAMIDGWSSEYKEDVADELNMYTAYVIHGIMGLFMKNIDGKQGWSAEEMGHMAGEVTNWLDEELLLQVLHK